MILAEDPFQPDLDSLLKKMFGNGLELLQDTQYIWIKG